MKHERETLEAVINGAQRGVTAAQAARRRTRATRRRCRSWPAPRAQLNGALGRLFALAEAYPDLKANQNMLQLQEELTSTENKVAFARQAFNDSVMDYNNRREMFPGDRSSPACSASRRAALLEIRPKAGRGAQGAEGRSSERILSMNFFEHQEPRARATRSAAGGAVRARGRGRHRAARSTRCRRARRPASVATATCRRAALAAAASCSLGTRARARRRGRSSRSALSASLSLARRRRAGRGHAGRRAWSAPSDARRARAAPAQRRRGDGDRLGRARAAGLRARDESGHQRLRRRLLASTTRRSRSRAARSSSSRATSCRA